MQGTHPRSFRHIRRTLTERTPLSTRHKSHPCAASGHSAVQVKEFHARGGASTGATPNVQVSVENPEQSRGRFPLVVDERGSSRQLRGQVNHPLVFTDTATHREYALVVLSVVDQQVY